MLIWSKQRRKCPKYSLKIGGIELITTDRRSKYSSGSYQKESTIFKRSLPRGFLGGSKAPLKSNYPTDRRQQATVINLDYEQATIESQKMLSAAAIFVIRALGVTFSALGGIWVARALGPEKLGISTLVLSFVSFIGAFTSLNQNYNFVRRGKNLQQGGNLESIVSDVFSLRLGLASILLCAGFFAILMIKIDSKYYLSVGAGALLALLQSNDAGWVLQLKDRMPWLYVAMSAQSAISGILCIALIRPEWPAGSDISMGCIGALAGFLIAWWFACNDWIYGIKISFSGFMRGAKLLNGGRWLAIMGITGMLLSNAELPMISALTSFEELGVYRASLQFINIINPFLPLFFYRLYPRLIDQQKEMPDEFHKTQLHALSKVALFGIPSACVASLVAPFVYPLVFGPKFSGAALPFVILFCGKIISVASNIFMWGGLAIHRDREVVMATIAVACLNPVLNLLLIPKIGIIGAATVSLFCQICLFVSYSTLVLSTNLARTKKL